VGCARSIAGHASAETEEEPAEPAVTVRVAPAEVRTLEQTVRAFGQCEALVGKLAMLTPVLEGHVHTILVEQGASVKAGQPIIELDPKLPAADLAEKHAMREGAKASLELLLSLPRSEEQDISKLAIEQARVALDRAQSQLDHLKPLAQRNEVSPQQLFDAEKAVEQARLQKESAEAQYRLSMLGPRAEAADEGKARVLIADQAVKTSQARLDFHTLRAPIDGVLQDLTCHPGQTIAAGTSVGEIVDSRQLYVLAWLPVGSAQLVRAGQKAKVTAALAATTAAPAADDEGKATLTLAGEVVFIGQIADPQTGNLPIRCLVDNPDALLAVGQSVSISITVREESSMLSVPTAAIFDLGEGPLVNVVRDGKSVTLHPTLGTSHDGWTAISNTDLREGELVVIEGGYNLKDETPVAVEDAQHVDQPNDEP
jgi:RND family efflux transporter MFP subunit